MCPVNPPSSDEMETPSRFVRATDSIHALPVLLGESTMCEKTLLAAAKRGQSAAFDALCQPYSRKLYQTTFRITRNREDAEDALQDAFLSAFVHLKNFDERSTFATWLTRIAINSALMILRKRRSSLETAVVSGDDSGSEDA